MDSINLKLMEFEDYMGQPELIEFAKKVRDLVYFARSRNIDRRLVVHGLAWDFEHAKPKTKLYYRAH